MRGNPDRGGAAREPGDDAAHERWLEGIQTHPDLAMSGWLSCADRRRIDVLIAADECLDRLATIEPGDAPEGRD